MAKILIDLDGVHFEAEGEEPFIKELYSDFKTLFKDRPLDKKSPHSQSVPENNLDQSATKPSRRKKPSTQNKKSAGQKTRPRNSPQVVNNLPLDDLKEAYEQKKPKSNSELLLTFAAFLRDRHEIEPCTIDQLYTCYWALRTELKIPKAFKQAIIDTKNKKHWLDLTEDGNVKITNIGENALHHELGKDG